MSPSRALTLVAFAIGGAAVGAVLTLAASGGGPAPTTSPAPARVDIVKASTPSGAVLVWTPLRMPRGYARGVARSPMIRHVAQVRSGEAWMHSASTKSLSAPAGYAYPLETAAVPRSYAWFLPPEDRQTFEGLGGSGAIVGSTAAAMFGLDVGSRIHLDGATLRVRAVFPDALVGANALVVPEATGARIGVVRPRYMLISAAPGTRTARLDRELHRLLPAPIPLQMRTTGSTPFLRQGDAVLSQTQIQRAFGAFAARRVGAGLQIDPAWIHSHIVTRKVPIIGRVTCNAEVFGPLAAALTTVKSEGLAHLIAPADSRRCFLPGFLNGDPALSIAHSSWGITIDINLSQNPYGGKPHMDARIVQVFTDHGFAWGGNWMVPFGAQFEYVGSP